MSKRGDRFFYAAAAVGILLSALCLVAAVSDPARLYRPDSSGYLSPAHDLAAGRGYTTTERPPGYPLLAAAVYALGGSDGCLALAGYLSMLGGCALIALAGAEYGGKPCGKAAGLLALFNLTLIANAPLLLSDTWFFLFAALQFLLFVRFWKRDGTAPLLGCAAVAGWATLIRPVNLFFIFPLLTLAAVHPRLTWRRKLAGMAGAAAIFAAFVLPWMARNHAVGATFSIYTNTGAMRHQNGAMLLAEVNGTDFETEKARLLAEEQAMVFPDARSREKWRVAGFLRLVAEHPFIYFRQHFDWRILLPDVPTLLADFGADSHDRGTMGILKRSGLVAAVRHVLGPHWGGYLALLLPLLAVTGVLYAGTLWKLVADCRHFAANWRELLIFLAAGEYYLLLPGAITAPRYQLPALPLLCTLAGMVIAELWTRYRSRNSACAT